MTPLQLMVRDTRSIQEALMRLNHLLDIMSADKDCAGYVHVDRIREFLQTVLREYPEGKS